MINLKRTMISVKEGGVVDVDIANAYLKEARKTGGSVMGGKTNERAICILRNDAALGAFLCCDSVGDVFYRDDGDFGPSGINDACVNAFKQITLADLKPNAKPFLQTGEAFEHTKTLNFILERMINVHGEHESVDYIHKLRNAIMFVEKAEEPTSMAGAGVKPKRTKVAYVKCEFDKLSEAFAEHEASPLYNESGALLDTPMVDRGLVDTFHGGYQIYRKVDREVTWQEEVKRHIDENSDIYEIELSSSHVLVNMEISNKNFIAMCRAVASMTDKPE